MSVLASLGVRGLAHSVYRCRQCFITCSQLRKSLQAQAPFHFITGRYHATSQSSTAISNEFQGLNLTESSSRNVTHKDIKLPKGIDRPRGEAWTALLDPFLPLELRKDRIATVPAFADDRQAISYVLEQGRRKGNFDVLAHLGYVEQRWSALLWLVNTLVEEPRPLTFFRDATLTTPARWPRDKTLDEITSMSKAPESLLTPVEDEAIAMADPNVSLHDLTSVPYSTTRSSSIRKRRDALGHLWRTLGSLILMSASSECQNPTQILLNVVRIIAQLHRQGYIPERIYAEPRKGQALALRQPPLLHTLSNDIVNSLVTVVSVEPRPSEDLLRNVVEFKPEFWLEYVLWCCLHGGWLIEGAEIISKMKRQFSHDEWRLISWYSGSGTDDARMNEVKALKLFVGAHDSNFGLFGESQRDDRPSQKAISSEVVIAYIDGLLSLIESNDASAGTVSQTLQYVRELKDVLEGERMSLGISTWDEVVARFAELSNVSVENDPKIMESILELTETFGRELSATNAVANPSNIPSTSSSYMFDGSATSLGLYHRVLLAYIKGRDTDGALGLLAKLQHFTDQNKTRALHDFMRKLRQENLPDQTNPSNALLTRQDPNERLTGLDYPSFFPKIPSVILGALLDLITDSSAHEIGDWMINSQDVDGPLIPPELYSDQSLAPALIRFAAVAKDDTLLQALKKVQSRDVSGPTLLALVESYFLKCNWRGAVEAIGVINEYSMLDWDEKKLAKIVRALLQHLHKDAENEVSSRSINVLRLLFQGRLGQIWGSDPSTLDSIVGIIATAHPRLAEFSQAFLSNSHESKLRLSRESFHILLEGVTKAFGSITGQRLWEIWCRSPLATRTVREPDRSTVTNIPVSEKAELFSAGHDQPGPSRSPPLAPTFTGFIKPNLATMRIIIHQAVAEARESAKGNEQDDAFEQTIKDSTVLAWANDILKRQLNLRNIDIEHELGDLPIKRQALPRTQRLYSMSTMKSWKALYYENAAWAMANESKMRVFAITPEQEHAIFDATDSPGRRFLHCLAADFGLMSESFGEADERQVTVFKTNKKPEVPSLTVSEAA